MSNQGGGSNRWDVMSIREYERNGETKTQWTKIGVAFTNKNGSINVQLDCLPIDGKCQLQVPLTQAEKDALFGNRQERGGGGQQQQRQQGGYSGRQQQQGNPRNAGQQQRQQAQQRFGQRPQAQPQRFAPSEPYTPDPHADAGAYQEAEPGWDVNGVWITDAKDLPEDHPDFIPF